MATKTNQQRPIVKIKLPANVHTEVLLVCGVHIRDGALIGAADYWRDVWEFLRARYPDMMQQSEYPNSWRNDSAHEHDMDILTEIHNHQQRERGST